MDWQPPHPQWVIQPLVDAGLEDDRIRDLVLRLGLEIVVRDGYPTITDVISVVADEPPEVRAAWGQVVGRLIG